LGVIVVNWRESLALLLAWLAIALAGGAVAAGISPIVRRRGPVLPPQRRRVVAWTGPFIIVAFLALFLAPSIVQHFIDAKAVARWLYGLDTNTAAVENVAPRVVELIAVPLQIAAWYGLAALARGGLPTFGIVPGRLAADFVAAFRAWLLLTPGVYAVSLIALIVYAIVSGQPPAEHPVLQPLERGPVPAGVAIVMFVVAIVDAPIREEVFFRGILQPFFADRPWGGDLAVWLALIFGIVIHRPGPIHWSDPADVASAAAPALLVLAVLPFYWRIDVANLSRRLPVRDPAARRRAARAIVGTSLLFANFHANVWPTPVPLFFLALGLGWLAYRTQSIAAPIFLHVLFNAIVFVALPLQNLFGRPG
jgi:membrane protease YdiL (CAAX protease family)